MEAGQLIRRADVAMYVAKDRHLGVAAYHVDEDDYSAAALRLVGELPAAIEDGQLTLHFQPKVSLECSRVTGLDFSERMLERARGKSAEIEWVQGDMLALPFADETFDAATVGFGVRNVADLELALRELRRVLRPGGCLAILEDIVNKYRREYALAA